MTAGTLPIWVEYVRALAVPFIAGAAALIAWSNYALSMKRRRDDLFDRRFDLFKRVTNYQCYVSNPNAGQSVGILKERVDLLVEAELLFNKRFSNKLQTEIDHTEYVPEFDVDDRTLKLFRDEM